MRLNCTPGDEPEIGTGILAFTSYDGADRTRMLSQWYKVTDHMCPGTVAVQPTASAFWTKWSPGENAPHQPISVEPYQEISMIDEYRRRHGNGR